MDFIKNIQGYNTKFIYKNINYKTFINNILHISDKLKQFNKIVLYLPNCFQYIEFG